MTLHQRFEKFIMPEPMSGCWLWIGCLNNKASGYGIFSSNNKPGLAHRMSYQMYKGEIPNGMCVLHSCDVRSCVNPDHLFLGTYFDNAKDMFSKGRNTKLRAYGESVGGSKLKESDVLEIRNLKKIGVKTRFIVNKYNVTKENINYILSGKTWKHLLPESRLATTEPHKI